MPAPDQQQQQVSLVSRVLFSTNPTRTYACDLLRPFYAACSAGRAAALRTLDHLGLHRWHQKGMPYSRQLDVLEAADQVTAMMIRTDQIAGLLEAWEQQQLSRDLAALEATLAHILDMEGSLRGAPYVAASSSTSSSSTAGFATTASSSRAATAATCCSAPPLSAVKPRGPQLTQLNVAGDFTKDTVKQLVRLLDTLPATQHLGSLVLQTSTGDDLFQIDRNSIKDELSGVNWPWQALQAAKEEADMSKVPTAISNSSSTTSGIITTTTTSSSSSSSSSQRVAAASGAAAGPTWRSRLQMVLVGSDVTRPQGTHIHLINLAPLLGETQQLLALGLSHVHVEGLPKCAALLRPLRVLHIKRAELGGPGVLDAIAGLTNLRHLGFASCHSAGMPEVCTFIPAAFSGLGHLTSMDLMCTPATAAGLEGVFGITTLKKLNLSGSCASATIPSSISRLAHLESLRLHEGRVSTLPDAMTALTRLRRLEWSTGDPWPLQLEVVWRLKSLEHLVVGENCMEVLPAAIAQLTALTYLCIEAPVKDVQSLTALVGLQQLLLHTNQADEEGVLVLPQGITALTKVTRMFFTERQMEHQSPAVRQFVGARMWLPTFGPGHE